MKINLTFFIMVLTFTIGNSQDILDSLQGSWYQVHINVKGTEVDCENYESALIEQIKLNPKDSSSIKSKFEIACKKMESTIIEFHGKTSIHKRVFENGEISVDSTNFLIENNVVRFIEEVTPGEIVYNEFQINFIDKDRFIWVHKEDMWIELKRKKN